MNQLATVERVRTATVRKQCSTFFFFGRGGGGGGGCFVASASSGPYQAYIVFKADILSTDYFFATAPIGYRIRVLEAIGAAEHNEPGL